MVHPHLGQVGNYAIFKNFQARKIQGLQEPVSKNLLQDCNLLARIFSEVCKWIHLPVSNLFSLLHPKKKKKSKRMRQNYFGGLDIANHNDTYIYIYMFIYFQFTSTLINVCLFGSKQLSFYVLIHLFIKYFEYLACVRHWVMYRRLRD